MDKTLSREASAELIETLHERFEANKGRHEGVNWDEVEARLKKNWKALRTLSIMEETGGEPDVVGRDDASGKIIFFDCSPESPKGRRSLCYDRAALNSRKENKPRNSAVEMADEMGAKLLTEDEYRKLQQLGEFDLKTSSWIETPESVRKLGGAIFCDRRFGRVFTYHNGAESYYAARGFRASLRV